MAIHYCTAQSIDRPGLVALLQKTDLLTDDLPSELAGFRVALSAPDGELVGVAGLESFGRTGLLRSVAVRPDYQHQHIGGQLVNQLLTQTHADGLVDLYLLTTSASSYFERYGFAAVARETVPDAIRQFNGLCPDSAILMHKAF